jgi:lysophospholipase L1-like esterase
MQRFPIRLTATLIAGVLLAPLLAAAAPINPAAYAGPIRVACVGASITQGRGATPGHGYTDDLQALLGTKWAVSNFGVSGTTMMRVGPHPYETTKACQAAHDLQPDVVIILLGSNDTKPSTWPHRSQYAADAREFIDSFKVLASHPSIYICRLPPVTEPGNYGINPAHLRDELVMIDAVAKTEGIDEIDVYSALLPHPDLFPDHVHPNNAGAMIIAQTVASTLTGK